VTPMTVVTFDLRGFSFRCNCFCYSFSVSANSRLTIATHALTWMAGHEHEGAGSSTSEQIAKSVRTNPVVIRRLMAQLGKAGIVASKQGAGSGWRLARTPQQIRLSDIDGALGSENLFALHRNEPSPNCPIAQGIRPVLTEVYDRVDAAVRQQLEQTTLADVLRDTVKTEGAQRLLQKGENP
jgi:Rrf2 family protein